MSKKVKSGVLVKDKSYVSGEEYLSSNPHFHHINYFHRFMTSGYDYFICSKNGGYFGSEYDYSNYNSHKRIKYEFIMHNTEASILKSDYTERMLSTRPSVDSTLYPLAIRYMDKENGIYVIERPPFQIPIDYSMKKFNSRKQLDTLKDKLVWIPWTISIVNMGTNASDYEHRLYFRDSPLNSCDDILMSATLPNLFHDGRICFGDSINMLANKVNAGEITYDIASVFTYMFNDYFSVWNPDIAFSSEDIHSVLSKMGIFDRIRKLKLKKMPASFDVLRIWRSSSAKFWHSFLYVMSFLNYEETIDFYNQVHRKKYSDAGDRSSYTLSTELSRFYTQNAITFSDKNYFVASIPDFSSYGRGSWSKIFSYVHQCIFKSVIDVHVENIPENVLIDQSFVSNKNLSAYIYFRTINVYIECYKEFFNIEYINMIQFRNFISYENNDSEQQNSVVQLFNNKQIVIKVNWEDVVLNKPLVGGI